MDVSRSVSCCKVSSLEILQRLGARETSLSICSNKAPGRILTIVRIALLNNHLYYRGKVLGIDIFTFTVLPRGLPGLNLDVSIALMASSSQPEPIPRETTGSTTFPFSSTTNCTITFPFIPTSCIFSSAGNHCLRTRPRENELCLRGFSTGHFN